MNNLPTIDVFNEKYACDYNTSIVYDNFERGKHYIVEVINHNNEDKNKYFVIKIIDFDHEIIVSQTKYVFTRSQIWVIDPNIDLINTKPKSYIIANTRFYKYVFDYHDEDED
jgi:hypothetical protein